MPITIEREDSFAEITELVKKSPNLAKAAKTDSTVMLLIADIAGELAAKEKVSDKDYEVQIKSSPTLSLLSKDSNMRIELTSVLKEAVKITKNRFAPSASGGKTAPSGGDDADESSGISAGELNLKVLTYLSDIPIARHGDIITSEHHNSLRRALYALADGIDVEAENAILTFAPNLMPVTFDKKDKERDWKVIYNKALIPPFGERGGAGGSFSGAFVVRLPENFLIEGMIVRGSRIDEEFDDPKVFQVTLSRVEMNKANAKPSNLITFDLKEETGFFQKKGTPSSSGVRVENEKYQYFVSAFWQDEDDSAGFELRAVQIFCKP